MKILKVASITLLSACLVQPLIAGPAIPVPDIRPDLGDLALDDLDLLELGPVDDTWVNINSETDSMTKLIIHDSSSISGFGACTPTDCEWGKVDIIYYNDSPSGENKLGAIATWDSAVSTRNVELCQNDNYATINARLTKKYSAGDTRSNYIKQYIFQPLNGTSVYNKTLPECTTAGTTAIFSSEYDFHVPRAHVTLDDVPVNLWLKLKFVPTDDGKLWWVFDSESEAGVNQE